MNDTKDLIKIKIDYLKTELTCLWSTGALTLGSSFVFLMNGGKIINDIIIGILGFIISFILFNGFLVKRTACHNLIKDYEKEVTKK